MNFKADWIILKDYVPDKSILVNNLSTQLNMHEILISSSSFTQTLFTFYWEQALKIHKLHNAYIFYVCMYKTSGKYPVVCEKLLINLQQCIVISLGIYFYLFQRNRIII
jgi:hypothetical protein